MEALENKESVALLLFRQKDSWIQKTGSNSTAFSVNFSRNPLGIIKQKNVLPFYDFKEEQHLKMLFQIQVLTFGF